MISSSESFDPTSCCVREAERILRYSFHKLSLLEEALTHPTFFHGAISYQRLELVGDAALSLALAKLWYSFRPDFGPYHLTVLESANLCNNNLARVALKRGIYPLIRQNFPGLDKEGSIRLGTWISGTVLSRSLSLLNRTGPPSADDSVWLVAQSASAA